MKLWTYLRRFDVDGVRGEVRTVATTNELKSTLLIDGHAVAEDSFEVQSARALRNNELRHVLPDGRRLEVESGYVGWWKTQIAVRINDQLVFESAPGARIRWPQYFVKNADRLANQSPEEAEASQAEARRQSEQFTRNKPSLLFDMGIALLFFVVAKFSNLTTAALVGAGAGIIGWVVQRITKIDLMGGLATFGIIMSLVTAGFAYAFQNDDMVKLRTTIMGLLTALIFLGDGLMGGRYLGKRLVRYMPHPDTSPSRLVIGIGLVGIIMATLNQLVANFTSTDVWLVYHTFIDIIIAMGLTLYVIKWASPKL